ncbi:hypothetical protein F543_5300 [Bibersteinia trehalosi USDA-ARS-USMARC-189]|uniref:Uncharacterized protein n=1 Tax=Bibersteinia trehalosi USDA-ARS-USMARC-189 TaxID=1263831 RepID=A0ABN4C422_BIBTR|nr:hypothetical protein F543_5300 [Bibersteinia trehalosi USDA-ARS-USMARC-189]
MLTQCLSLSRFSASIVFWFSPDNASILTITKQALDLPLKFAKYWNN